MNTIEIFEELGLGRHDIMLFKPNFRLEPTEKAAWVNSDPKVAYLVVASLETIMTLNFHPEHCGGIKLTKGDTFVSKTGSVITKYYITNNYDYVGEPLGEDTHENSYALMLS